uniref:Uncharacterized protein n=1 Tax=Arundo donax TaxID=35708 RepID=A0A0A8Z9X6_ARUDO
MFIIFGIQINRSYSNTII